MSRGHFTTRKTLRSARRIHFFIILFKKFFNGSIQRLSQYDQFVILHKPLLTLQT